MHTGFTTHRPDLFDNEHRPEVPTQRRLLCLHCGQRLIPAIGGTEGWYHVVSGNRRCDGALEGTSAKHSTLGVPAPDSPFARSSATGSSWPQGRSGYALPKQVEDQLLALVAEVAEVPDVPEGAVLVQVVSVVSWDGSVVVLFGRTDTHDVTFACDPRAASELQYRLDTEDEVLALVESWQFLSQRERRSEEDVTLGAGTHWPVEPGSTDG